jgi:hypothetical protein
MNKTKTLVCQKGMKLSEQLKRARTDRPDEWTMDRYIAKATEMEEAYNLFYGRKDVYHREVEVGELVNGKFVEEIIIPCAW